MFGLSNTCKTLNVNVDDYDEVNITSSSANHSVSANSTCLAYFKTSQADQGLCVRMNGVHITSRFFKIEFWTGPYGPERVRVS